MVENVKFLSDEYRNNHKEIPWGQIIGFRNRLVHAYTKTDYMIVYKNITRDLVTLKKVLVNSIETNEV